MVKALDNERRNSSNDGTDSSKINSVFRFGAKRSKYTAFVHYKHMRIQIQHLIPSSPWTMVPFLLIISQILATHDEFVDQHRSKYLDCGIIELIRAISRMIFDY